MFDIAHLSFGYAQVPVRTLHSDAEQVPELENSIHRIKHDGYRLIVHVRASACSCSSVTVTIGAVGFR